MDSDAFRISAAALQQAYKKESADLHKALEDGKIEMDAYVKLKASLEVRHNERVTALNLQMIRGRPAPDFSSPL